MTAEFPDLDRIYLPEGTINPELTVTGRNGMVVAEHPLAAQAGLQILQAGGNAVDAAVAVAACLSVVTPYMIGPAGIGYMLFYETRSSQGFALDFGGALPSGIPARLDDPQPLLEGPRAALVPGNARGWFKALDTFGTMERVLVLSAAIRMAEEGFPISPKQVPYFQRCAALLSRFPATAAIFLPQGRPPRAGEILVQRDLGRTLRRLSEGGADVLYQGELGDAIVRGSEREGGWIAREDLAAFKCDWGEPLRASFRGYEVMTIPPPCMGAQILETLILLEAMDWSSWEPNSPEYIHHLVEAIKIAAADRVAYGARGEPWQRLLSGEYAAERVREIDPRAAASSAGDRYLPDRPSHMVREGAAMIPDPLHTTHFAVIDREGNAVSTTQTLGTLFGSGYVVPGTGLLLNNKAYWADRDPGSPNALAPGKRIGMNVAPALVTRNQQLAITVGSPGSFGILQIIPQLVMNRVAFGMSPQRAVAQPRVISLGLGNESYLKALGPRGDGRLLALESRIPRSTASELIQRGHDVRYVGEWANLMGCGAILARDVESGVLVGGADPRRDGQVLCW